MREWNLRSGDPLSLILAADARLCRPDYTNDQIWELFLGNADPGAVVLQTTYGLRARSMRLFPVFSEGDVIVSDTADYETPPAVHQFFPNYINLTFSPFPGIDVTAEYWVPESQVIAGRLRFFNSGVTPRRFRFEWVALLAPSSIPLAFSVALLTGTVFGLYPAFRASWLDPIEALRYE